eukprot:CAMPEP_0170474270 /NCGR_PEP_ID=MMETSP0123-20130129/16058_1 /TAXON_ID=182087 /ORGANISM="Favella ehrenbergii, Strain Fehren 1" /LENGTH=54 /DNA_ID=CAMNT_0010743887 /DNA_START=160 /DNA_END=324 /DNA_ORIENTATION=-
MPVHVAPGGRPVGILAKRWNVDFGLQFELRVLTFVHHIDLVVNPVACLTPLVDE